MPADSNPSIDQQLTQLIKHFGDCCEKNELQAATRLLSSFDDLLTKLSEAQLISYQHELTLFFDLLQHYENVFVSYKNEFDERQNDIVKNIRKIGKYIDNV